MKIHNEHIKYSVNLRFQSLIGLTLEFKLDYFPYNKFRHDKMRPLLEFWGLTLEVLFNIYSYVEEIFLLSNHTISM